MANKNYRIVSPAKFTGSRALTGVKGVKNQDVRFFNGESEAVSGKVAKAFVAERRDYKAVALDADEDVDPSDMKVDELKAALDGAGIEYPDSAKKAELVELYNLKVA